MKPSEADMEAAREIAEAITYGTIPTTREITERIAAALAKRTEECAQLHDEMAVKQRESAELMGENKQYHDAFVTLVKAEENELAAAAIRALNGGKT